MRTLPTSSPAVALRYGNQWPDQLALWSKSRPRSAKVDLFMLGSADSLSHVLSVNYRANREVRSASVGRFRSQ